MFLGSSIGWMNYSRTNETSMALFYIPQYCIWGGSWTQEHSTLARFELRLGLSDTKF
jgi:hypothetical protein